MLTDAGLMEEEERFLITAGGVELADHFAREVLGDESNGHARHAVDRVAEAWSGRMAAKPLLDHVYGFPERVHHARPHGGGVPASRL